MAIFHNSSKLLAAQYIDDILRCSLLFEAQYARENFLTYDQAINQLGRVQTNIAVATGLVTELGKIIKQYLTATGLRFSKGLHGCEFLHFHLIAFGFVALLNPLSDSGCVFFIKQQKRFSFQSVPAGAPRFLIIAFNTAGDVMVHHKPYIRLVYAHAKGNGGNHNIDLVI